MLILPPERGRNWLGVRAKAKVRAKVRAWVRVGVRAKVRERGLGQQLSASGTDPSHAVPAAHGSQRRAQASVLCSLDRAHYNAQLLRRISNAKITVTQ